MFLRMFLIVFGFGFLVSDSPAAEPTKRILLVGSLPDGHPPQTHEYATGLKILSQCLKSIPGLEVNTVIAEGLWKEGPELINRADGVVIFLAEGAKWFSADEKRLKAFRELADRRGGLVCLHWAMGTKDAGPIEAFVKLFGGCHGGPDRKYQVLETQLSLPNPKHPAATGIVDFKLKDEFYYRLKFATEPAVTPILQARIDGEKHTVCWAWERANGGRSFGFSGLHFHENWKRMEYRRLVTQGVLWSVGAPVPAQGLELKLEESVYLVPAKK